MFNALFSGRRLWMTLLAIAGAIVMGRLGIWQLDRLAQRHAMNAMIIDRMTRPAVSLADAARRDAAAPEYRRVAARGVYDAAQEIVLRNRALDGAPGVHVLTPLRLSGSAAAVLVDRGWIPMAQADQAGRRAYAPPAGDVVITGVARRPQQSGPQDPPLPPNQRRLDAWFQLDLPRIQQQTGYALLPVYIELQPVPGSAALPRPIATTALGEGPHLGYAIQWFAFALILLIGYVAFIYQQLQRARSQVAAGAQGERQAT